MNLIDNKTGKRLGAVIKEMTKTEIEHLENQEDFDFEWNKEKEYWVCSLRLTNESENIGLISLIDYPKEFRIHINLIESSKKHRGKNKIISNIPDCLIGYACKQAFIKGYGGFVSLTPKTQLTNYYQDNYGFIPIGKQMAIFGKVAESLIHKYLENG